MAWASAILICDEAAILDSIFTGSFTASEGKKLPRCTLGYEFYSGTISSLEASN
jgi:hypothetical protein